jgi:uncharacterized protein YegL
LRKIIPLIFILIIMLPTYIPNANSQGIQRLEVNKIISPQRVLEGETVRITIKLTGVGDVGYSEVDVVLILDRSGSMSGRKIADAKIAAKAFLDFTDDIDRVGLITFSRDVKIESDLEFMNSANKDILKSKIDSFKVSAAGTTNIYDAIKTSNELLLDSAREDIPLVEVLLTDGRHNYPALPDAAFESLAEETRANGITIYTIGLGIDVDTERLEMLADITGGEYYFAPTSEELRDIFIEIAGRLAIAGIGITVSETVPYCLSYNEDSSISPDEIDESSDTILKWDVGTLWINEVWEVSYTVRAEEAVDSSSAVSQTQIKYTTVEDVPVTINLLPGLVFHDIAITRLVAEPDRVSRGELVNILATVESKGMLQDACEVEMRLNNTLLNSQTVILEPNNPKNISYKWNTSDVQGGKYDVKVIADPNENIWEQTRTDNEATTKVDVSAGELSPIIFFVIVIFFLMIATSAVGGIYYSRRRNENVISSARATCPRCRSPLISDRRTGRLYCARCRRYFT